MQQTERPLRESLLISSERAASILLHLFATRVSLLLALQDTQHRQLHTAQERHQQRAQHPDTRRQIARDTPVYLSRHARRASRSVLGSSSEPGSVGRAGLTVAGLPLLRARYMVEEMGTDPFPRALIRAQLFRGIDPECTSHLHSRQLAI